MTRSRERSEEREISGSLGNGAIENVTTDGIFVRENGAIENVTTDGIFVRDREQWEKNLHGSTERFCQKRNEETNLL